MSGGDPDETEKLLKKYHLIYLQIYKFIKIRN